jgi:predicted transcriptional regulator
VRTPKSITLALSIKESDVLDDLAARKDLSKSALMRQALRLYQMIDDRLSKGHTMAFVDSDGQLIKTEIFGLGPLD